MTDTCEKHCEATAFKIVIKGLEGEVARLKEALAQEKALQALHNENERLGKALQVLHNENERLGLYKDAYAEPVAWMWDVNNGGGYTTRDVGLYQTSIPFAKHTPLYTHPPQRTEQELVDYEKLATLGWQAIECRICGGGAMGYPQRAEQEPVAKYSDIVSDGGLDPRNKFDVSPQRPWVGLTDEEHHEIVLFAESGDWHDFEVINVTEAKLKEKNT